MDDSPRTKPAFDWLPAILIALVLTFAITRQSFWIDESTIGFDAQQPTLRASWQQIYQAKVNDIQAPFYMTYIWAFARLGGTSEWALRAANLVWLLPGIILFVQGFRSRLDRWCLTLAVIANACLWYYVGEARLYSMLMGTSCLVFAAIHRLGQDDLSPREKSCWLTVLLAGFILVCGTTMLGAVWSCGSFLLLLAFVPPPRLLELWRAGKFRIAITVCLLLTLGAYYFWTLRLGARATNFAKTDWRSIGFIVYEHLGFSGLGPGRTDLRSGGVSELRPYAVKLLIYAALTGLVALCGAREIARRLTSRPAPSADSTSPVGRRCRGASDPLAPPSGERVRERGPSHPTAPSPANFPFRRRAGLLLAFAVPTILLLTVGMASHWRVLGRHCIVLMPGWITLMGLGLSALWRKSNPDSLALRSGERVRERGSVSPTGALSRATHCLWKAVGIAFLAMGLSSCVAIRFAIRHERDDYRDAALAAKAALTRGAVVWWNAVGDGAAYYQVPLSTNAPEPGKALLLVNVTPAALTALAKPDLVAVSKPELFDLESGVTAYLAEHHYKPVERYPSFTLWRP